MTEDPKVTQDSRESEDQATISARRLANAIHGLWLTDAGELIDLKQREKYERQHKSAGK